MTSVQDGRDLADKFIAFLETGAPRDGVLLGVLLLLRTNMRLRKR